MNRNLSSAIVEIRFVEIAVQNFITDQFTKFSACSVMRDRGQLCRGFTGLTSRNSIKEKKYPDDRSVKMINCIAIDDPIWFIGVQKTKGGRQ